MASIAWSDQLLVLAARLGHAVAVTDGQGQTLSFAQLSRQSHQLAHSLLKQGISSGQSVGVWLPNSLDAVLCAYGIRLMGAAETPLSWSLAPQEFQWCCGLAQVNWVITRAERMEQVRAWGLQPLLVDDLLPTDADAAAQQKIAAVVGKWVEQPTGIQIAKEVLVAASADDSLLFAAASRSIRDVDLIADHNGPNVVANLGVNGIDGLISTAAGIATFTNRHTYLLIGDIAFLHGSNGLLFPADELRPSLTIVVNDDNGGAIFSDLEQGAAQYSPWFERVFGTPHDLDLVALARGYGVDAVEAFNLTQLRDALSPHKGIRVVVVAGCDREKSRDMRAALRTS